MEGIWRGFKTIAIYMEGISSYNTIAIYCSLTLVVIVEQRVERDMHKKNISNIDMCERAAQSKSKHILCII